MFLTPSLSRLFKRALAGSALTAFALASVSLAGSPSRALAAETGALVKSDANTAVYYVYGGRRYAFPNERVFFSWYTDFSNVSTISSGQLATIPLSGNVTYRPGRRLVKITTDPKVYAVSTGGVLRWITSETVANALYGGAWASFVDDVPDTFFTNYRIGLPIEQSGQYSPNGQLSSNPEFGVSLTVVPPTPPAPTPAPSPTPTPTPTPTPAPVPTPTPAPAPTPTPTPTPTPDPTPTPATGTSYDIGSPTVQEIWVSASAGNDANNGTSRTSALKTLGAAWNKIPSGTLTGTGYRIQMMRGNYPESSIPNYWEDKNGTRQFPIIINSVDGTGTAVLQGDINAFDVSYFYLIGLNITPSPAGDALHFEKSDHILLRNVKLNGGNRVAHETLKVNQSQYFYIEDSEIMGAEDNAIDFVAVQYGHILRNKISNAQDWCMYVKGGSAYIRIEGNEIFNCGTGGFVAGQGTGFEFMTSPWIHYEAYGISFVNNVIRDTVTAGMGVNGGYNILFAHNTLVRAGTGDHFFEANQGRRGCDGDRTTCTANKNAGGWGNSGGEEQYIPNKNIFVYNNLFYGRRGNEVPYPLQVARAVNPPAGTNLSGPQAADSNLQIKGNLFWNGAVTEFGLDNAGCADSNPTCNLAQLTVDNTVGGTEPTFANLTGNDFHVTNNALDARSTFAWPSFDWSTLPTRPKAPNGDILVTVSSNRDGGARLPRAGAY